MIVVVIVAATIITTGGVHAVGQLVCVTAGDSLQYLSLSPSPVSLSDYILIFILFREKNLVQIFSASNIQCSNLAPICAPHALEVPVVLRGEI